MAARSGLSERVAAGVSVAIAVAVLGACYDPQIAPNTVRCATGAGVKQCPDDFQCVGGFCAKVGSSGSGGRAATGGAGAAGATGSGGMGSGGAGGTGGSDKTRPPYASCLISNFGQSTQSDNCMPGLICLDDCGTAQHCYPMCSTDADCPESACTRPIIGKTQKVCEQPFTACMPTTGEGCANPSICHLVGSSAAPGGGDRTTCECPGPGFNNDPCSSTQECSKGFTCPPAAFPGGEYCRRVCDPTATPTGCTAGVTCRAFGSKFGYCF